MSEIIVLPRNLVYYAEPEETIFDAAVRQGIRFPISCRNGVCEICRAQLVDGVCRTQGKQVEASEGHTPSSQILVCKTVAVSDCRIYVENVLGPGEVKLQKYACQVVSVDLIGGDVYRVILRPPAGKKVEFHPGQYLALQIPERDPAFFSIASSPEVEGTDLSRDIELNIQATPEWESAMGIIHFLRDNLTVNVELPMGKACLAQLPEKPLILVAAGTGFAQMKGIVEYVLAQKPSQEIALYWGGKTADDIYCTALPDKWAEEYENFSFSTVYGDVEDNEWPGHHEQLFEAVLADKHDLTQVMIFASGSPGMVYATMDAFLEKGMPEDAFYSDVLEYAPR